MHFSLKKNLQLQPQQKTKLGNTEYSTITINHQQASLPLNLIGQNSYRMPHQSSK